MKIWILGILALIVLAGCQTTLNRDEPISIRLGEVELATAPLVSALRTQSGTRVQALDGTWGERNFQGMCVLKGDGTNLTAIVLAAQVRLMTITLTPPHAIHCERVPQIPQSFEPEYALADFACVNLDTATLSHVLAPSCRVTDDGQVRRIATPAGKTLATYTRDSAGGGTYQNLVYGYTYRIKPISSTP